MDPQDAVTVLDEVGERVGPYGEAAWEILVRGIWAESLIGFLVGIGVLVLVGGLGVFMLYKGITWKPKHSFDDTEAPLMIFGTVFAVVGLIFGVGLAIRNFVGVVVPEFRALEHILRTIGG